jgi:predicted Rossmann fold nucleotide-binding protein DprA/Smf involved in DNA uptake
MKSIKIISGGQTGADRAALDWALARGAECGG